MKSANLVALCALLTASLAVQAGDKKPVVMESAREIPVAYDVDVVVVGGSTGAVAAAVEAAKSGANVFLAAPRAYLGEDVAGTLRLWLAEGEKPTASLAKKLFQSQGAALSADIGKSITFSYEADQPSAKVHQDSDPPSRLNDGIWGDASRESVQYDGDVNLTLDLGKVQDITDLYVMAYHRNLGGANPFIVDTVTVSTSQDKQQFTEAAAIKNPEPQGECIPLWTPVAAKTRYLRLAVKRAEGTERILLGEVIVARRDGPATSAAPRIPPATPLHIKRTLDEALLEAGVKFLFSCPATDVLSDGSGNPCGIVMANRAGRQAVRAKIVIDATARANLARLAGAQATPYPTGKQTFTRVVVGGEPQAAEHMTVRTVKPAFGGLQLLRRSQTSKASAGTAAIIEYTLRLPMKDGTFASFAEAEQAARDVTYHPDQQFTADTLFQVPPDSVKGKRGATGAWSGVKDLPLDAFRPAGVTRMYVLGGCADLSGQQKERLLRPLALIDMGTRIGAIAATEAKGMPLPQNVAVSGGTGEPVAKGDVRETLVGVRPIQKLPGITQQQRPLPVLGTYDVVVIGGGTGGAPAGISAARQGARTLVVEYLHALGGVGTVGAIAGYYWGNRVGFNKEILDGSTRWKVEHRMEWWRSELRKAGADIWFGTLGCGAFVDGNKIKGAVVVTPLGRGVVLAKAVIDSTGNADIAAAAGAECIYTDGSDIAVQGTGLPPRRLGASYTNTDYTIVDETDMMDVWHVYVYAKVKAGQAFDLGQLIDTRERRRIVGDFTISILDEINNRTYPDTVVQAFSDFDTHGYTVAPYFYLQHPAKGKGVTTNIPYRAMLPKGLDGILVTGLGISAQRDAIPLIRMQPDIENGGYAAGLAAAQAAKTGVGTRAVDVPSLQKQLVSVGNLTQSVLTDKDSFPLSDATIDEAVQSVADNYRGVAALLTDPERALPRLREAYQHVPTEHKLPYAHILGMMGDPTGLPTLQEAVDRYQEFDEGWNFKGMGQFGRNVSQLDSLMVAMGRTGDRRATPAIVDKVKLLKADDAFSHFRAGALALEALGDPRGAAPLAKALSLPGVQGNALTSVDSAIAREQSGRANWTAEEPRRLALRELMLARALYRCGDKDSLGKSILEKYTTDLRGHLARHAKAVLQEGK